MSVGQIKASEYFTPEEISKIKYLKNTFGWQELILFSKNKQIIFKEINQDKPLLDVNNGKKPK